MDPKILLRDYIWISAIVDGSQATQSELLWIAVVGSLGSRP